LGCLNGEEGWCGDPYNFEEALFYTNKYLWIGKYEDVYRGETLAGLVVSMTS
jgi:hypothetical protein